MNIKKRFDIPFIPLILSLLVLVICGSVGLYGFSVMVSNDAEMAFTTSGFSFFKGDGFLQGLSILSASVIAYVLWFEVGSNIILQKLK